MGQVGAELHKYNRGHCVDFTETQRNKLSSRAALGTVLEQHERVRQQWKVQEF